MQREPGIDPGGVEAVDALDQIGDLLRRRREAALVVAQRLAAKARMHIQRGQQRQPDAGALRGAHQGQRHLGRIGIGAAGRVVVHVMEFADLGVAGLQQLGIELCGNRLELIGVDAQRGAVHAVAPAPEVVMAARAAFGQAGDRALKRMAVGIDQPRQQRAAQLERLRRGGGRHARAHRGPLPLCIRFEQHVIGPARRQPGARGPQAQRCHVRPAAAQGMRPAPLRPCDATPAAPAQPAARPTPTAGPRSCRCAGTSRAAPHGCRAQARRSGA